MKKKMIRMFIVLLVLVSCGRLYKLSSKDYEWMPYKGNEILVFKSSKGEFDTIVLLKKDTMIAYPEAQSANGIKYEVVAVYCSYPGINRLRGTHQQSGYPFFDLEKSKDNKAELKIRLRAQNASFYRISSIKADSLARTKPNTMSFPFGKQEDVYIIEGEDYLGGLSERDDFVTKIYWSKSQGLLRYDKSSGDYWELISKL